ncbi:MAG TPA: shikimate dehydrogenase [Thermodesulfobacteriota bacterium]|nr:shikimate dehydrogenase [Thermodesulfobacteriota bacterium]
MKISGKTKLLGIFGDPIRQTLSPYMQNAAFEALGLEYVYMAFRISPENLKNAVLSIRALDMQGVNITVPHKESIMEFLDEIDDEAKAIGAVNTIVNRDGRLIGFNTDSRGYYLSLNHETGFDPAGKTITVIGAGGGARAILFSLLNKNPKKIIISNRTVERASRLCEELGKTFPGVEFASTGLNISRFASETDLLVNTTSSGMMAGPDEKPVVRIDALKKSAIVSDIVFRPLDTPLIKEALRLGLTAHKGLGMLVCQGALAFELWTGKEPPIEVMKFAGIQALGVK